MTPPNLQPEEPKEKPTVMIYVRRRKITRYGKRVDGWQAGFSESGGGPTAIHKGIVIEHQRAVAARLWPSAKVIVVDESEGESPDAK